MGISERQRRMKVSKKCTCKEREPFHRKMEYWKEKKTSWISYGLRPLFFVFQCSVTQPFVQGVLFFGGQNVGERAVLYVQRHFINKSCASKVVISQESYFRPQPQPDSPGLSQPAHHSHLGFLWGLWVTGFMQTPSISFHSAFLMQLLSALWYSGQKWSFTACTCIYWVHHLCGWEGLCSPSSSHIK